MARGEVCFSGVHPETGAYLRPPVALGDFEPEARLGGPLAARGLREGVDPKDLAQAGWGIVYPADAGERLRRALSPLVDLRREQAGGRMRECAYRLGETAAGFLRRHGVGPGPVDPEKLDAGKGLPYYLLLVGGPERIPFEFQFHLDVQYAVGRLSLASPREVRDYARGVVAAERSGTLRPNAAFFAPAHPGEHLTQLSAHELAAPLARRLAADYPHWTVRSLLGEAASKEQLGRLLGGEETPSLLFTAGHGLWRGYREPGQRQLQGGLVCQGWPGPGTPTAPENRFAAEDVAPEAALGGLIAFHFACYSAGIPRLDAFAPILDGKPRRVASRPFVAQLPRRLLGHPRGGALAVVGHVDSALAHSFLWEGAGTQLQTFESALARLLRGFPVGAAMDYFGSRYAEITAYLDASPGGETERLAGDHPERLALRLAAADARAWIVLGDPAVRLGSAP